MGYQARERMNSSFKSVPVLNKTVVIMSKHILLKLYGFLLRYSFEFQFDQIGNLPIHIILSQNLNIQLFFFLLLLHKVKLLNHCDVPGEYRHSLNYGTLLYLSAVQQESRTAPSKKHLSLYILVVTMQSQTKIDDERIKLIYLVQQHQSLPRVWSSLKQRENKISKYYIASQFYRYQVCTGT